MNPVGRPVQIDLFAMPFSSFGQVVVGCCAFFLSQLVDFVYVWILLNKDFEGAQDGCVIL